MSPWTKATGWLSRPLAAVASACLHELGYEPVSCAHSVLFVIKPTREHELSIGLTNDLPIGQRHRLDLEFELRQSKRTHLDDGVGRIGRREVTFA